MRIAPDVLAEMPWWERHRQGMVGTTEEMPLLERRKGKNNGDMPLLGRPTGVKYL
ncbi:hypothetical protein [Paenibacillus riograndensis]|uniref:hypothetical protein n=1 Tax=Paenibacillus riograndensis TaxID=483937 RepID=UPI0012FD14D8|nr:hypothetical protein [Paenibacillus riograndensis]